MTKNIKQTVTFKASPHEVYEALMDSKQHSQFTGQTAKISRKVGGRFSTFDGYATGKNLELKPDKKIVQEWRAADWPTGHKSVVKFELSATKDGTKLTFTHTNVPDKDCKNITSGWKEYYWAPMKQMLEQ